MIKKVFASLLIGVGMLSFTPVLPAQAACSGVDCITDGSNSAKTGGEKSDSVPEILKTVTNTLLFAIGAISVIFIIFGGFKYVTSNGEQASVKSAKDTIMYAVIGLVAAIAGWAIVDFIVTQFT